MGKYWISDIFWSTTSPSLSSSSPESSYNFIRFSVFPSFPPLSKRCIFRPSSEVLHAKISVYPPPSLFSTASRTLYVLVLYVKRCVFCPSPPPPPPQRAFYFFVLQKKSLTQKIQFLHPLLQTLPFPSSPTPSYSFPRVAMAFKKSPFCKNKWDTHSKTYSC